LLTVLETKSPTKPTACTLVCAGEGGTVVPARRGWAGFIVAAKTPRFLKKDWRKVV
jgi:hypothetical protein